MADTRSKVPGSPPAQVTLEDVSRLRHEWLHAQTAADASAHDLGAIAEALTFDSPIAADASAGVRASVGAARARARTKWLEYQDATALIEGAQRAEEVAAAHALAETNTKLAQRQLVLAVVIAVATIVQAGTAVIALWGSR
jgi:hypothetical protein